MTLNYFQFKESLNVKTQESDLEEFTFIKKAANALAKSRERAVKRDKRYQDIKAKAQRDREALYNGSVDELSKMKPNSKFRSAAQDKKMKELQKELDAMRKRRDKLKEDAPAMSMGGGHIASRDILLGNPNHDAMIRRNMKPIDTEDKRYKKKKRQGETVMLKRFKGNF